MQLQPIAQALGERLGLIVRFDGLDDVESQLRVAVRENQEAALDFFGLNAVEAAVVRSHLSGEIDVGVVVNADVYLTALEVFGCSPPDYCSRRLFTVGTMADVIPLRGDYVKVLGQFEAPIEGFGTEAAVATYRTLRDVYRSAEDLGRYAQLGNSVAPVLRVGLWMLKAATLQAVRGGNDRLARDTAADLVDFYLANVDRPVY